MSTARLHDWADLLERLAGGVLSGTPLVRGGFSHEEVVEWVSNFSDELGHRRVIDRALLGRLSGVRPEPLDTESLDVRLWWALFDDGETPEIETSGPLTCRRDDQGIELWTQIELGALHALWDLAIDRCDAGLRARCLEATCWHVAELQPDNATAHAWALHGFAICAGECGLEEAWVHAEMLLHATMVGRGRPDRFSACLMLDAARTLRGDMERKVAPSRTTN
ncbi:MAG: hypothetical protein KJZ65_01545 [Phycisphaerales bacterium]|nr:hypothetical protein [Phycisphaerales bacterium]